jgi:hypothetical protein
MSGSEVSTRLFIRYLVQNKPERHLPHIRAYLYENLLAACRTRYLANFPVAYLQHSILASQTLNLGNLPF